MINEFDKVILNEDIENSGLKTGDIGTVVMIHSNGSGYEVEFIALDGETIAIETLSAAQVRPISRGEIASSRKVYEANH